MLGVWDTACQLVLDLYGYRRVLLACNHERGNLDSGQALGYIETRQRSHRRTIACRISLGDLIDEQRPECFVSGAGKQVMGYCTRLCFDTDRMRQEEPGRIVK